MAIKNRQRGSKRNRSVARVIKNPRMRLPVRFIKNVPKGNAVPHFSAHQIPSQYRAFAPSMAPAEISKNLSIFFYNNLFAKNGGDSKFEPPPYARLEKTTEQTHFFPHKRPQHPVLLQYALTGYISLPALPGKELLFSSVRYSWQP